jgi:hypothetical protein
MKTELSMVVDLDAGGVALLARKIQQPPCQYPKTGAVNLAALEAYLKGQMSFDNSVLEAIQYVTL